VKTLLRWLAFALLLSLAIQERTAEGWSWNPFAKDNKTPTKNVSATRTTLINGKKVSSPVSNQWRSVPPGASQPGMAMKAMSNAVDAITFKPLRNKLVGPPASQWSKKPPSSTVRSSKDAKPSFFGSLFKPAQPKPPSTVTEWINQPSPKF
jgi:hypothetical protein